MEATLLTHTLDIAVEHLQRRGRKLPTHLHVQADNTSREMRNQITAKWGAVLVAKGLFRSVTFGYLPVGHTRNDVDQRVSTVATLLAGQAVLETSEDSSCSISLQQSIEIWWLMLP